MNFDFNSNLTRYEFATKNILQRVIEKRLTKQTKDLEELPTPVKTVFEQVIVGRVPNFDNSQKGLALLLIDKVQNS